MPVSQASISDADKRDTKSALTLPYLHPLIVYNFINGHGKPAILDDRDSDRRSDREYPENDGSPVRRCVDIHKDTIYDIVRGLPVMHLKTALPTLDRDIRLLPSFVIIPGNGRVKRDFVAHRRSQPSLEECPTSRYYLRSRSLDPPLPRAYSSSHGLSYR